MPEWRPWREADLLTAHRILMEGLIDSAGHYRSGDVGVMGEGEVIHIAPSANRAPQLMGDLLNWLRNSDQHLLIASSIFHYEFEFIPPFEDGNGRMGRLWQTLILSRWNPVFAVAPVESMVHARQQDYYTALNQSSQEGNSEPFVEFVLHMILAAVKQLSSPQVDPQVAPQVMRLLNVLKGEMSRQQLQAALDLTDRRSFRSRYLVPALNAGLIEMTLPGKPNSRQQKYRLTASGNRLKNQAGRSSV